MSKICPRCSELFPDDAGFCAFDGAELAKTSDRFLGKTIAARYRLTKKLGSGGMSIVYLARHELISRLSAIKILRPELSRIAEHRERFLREARAVNRINHENIVEITDVGESDGVAYLVMEYVAGESLLVQVQQGPLRWERAVRIAVQVSSALARAHQMGIIHRDLKPENILLIPRKAPSYGAEHQGSSPELVKLTDFGIAKMMGEPTLTLNEQLFGTPGYIAPEYVLGLPIDGRADIYSLAVVLYEMITGRLPFEGRGQSDLLLKPLTSVPLPPSQHVQGLPPDLEGLLLRSLAREPSERPHDAFALHDALLEILQRCGTSLPPPSVGPVAPIENARQPMETVPDRTSAPPLASQRGTAKLTRAEGSSPPVYVAWIDLPHVRRSATSEMSSRWETALVDLETVITRARRAGGASAAAAGRASELALVAREVIPRVERAEKVVADMQAKLDQLEAVGREFRGNLGHAIDVLVHDRSRELAHLEALRARRSGGASSPAGSSARPSEALTLATEEHRAQSVVEDLDFQIAALQKQLDTKNDEHERALLEVTGTLEGSLSALQQLRHELARTIDDGLDMLQGM